MILSPHTVMTVFGEPAFYEDAMKPVALDLWRLLGRSMLLLFGLTSYGLYLQDADARFKTLPFMIIGGSVLTLLQAWIQTTGRWNNLRIIVPVMEGLMVIMHIREYLHGKPSAKKL